jgi:hypothetical protein
MTPLKVKYTRVKDGSGVEIITCFLHEFIRDETGKPCGILELPTGHLVAVPLHGIRVINPLIPEAG